MYGRNTIKINGIKIFLAKNHEGNVLEVDILNCTLGLIKPYTITFITKMQDVQ